MRIIYAGLLLCGCVFTAQAQKKPKAKIPVKQLTIPTPPAQPEKPYTPGTYTSTKQLDCKNGAVVSAHPLASEAGLQMLKKGGNAFDAAIATQWALAVVYPNAGNIGGGGFLVARQQDGKALALDYREMAPAAAGRDMYLDTAGNAQTALSQQGHLASGVPGTVAGLFETLKYAKLPMDVLLQPAIDYASKGFVITEREARALNGNDSDFRKLNTKLPVLVKEGGWKAGDTLVQADLAQTLIRIQKDGAKGFYEGTTADLIVAEMKRGNGIITLEDLKNYKAKWREPLQHSYRGKDIIGMPPPSSGGILVQQILRVLESYPLKDYGFQTKAYVQLLTELERRAYADRAEFLGDPDFHKVPVKTLVSDRYIFSRMIGYDSSKAGSSEKVKHGTIKESEETTHLSVMDKAGNCVSVTTTLNGSYGSKTVVGDAGFLLNNEMDDFSVKPGVPNMYGAVGGEANAIVPGKRMLSSMTPTIVLKRKKPFIICGTPGGTTIITSVLQTILNIVDFDMTAADAVNKPKFHHQWLPDVIFVEKTFPQNVREQLEAMGYKLMERGAIGRTEVIKVLPNGTLQCAADGRGDDSVAGY
jgi:gamma-glutamyltranspeptidase / glutathione hydrolase